ncbi:hypothetical protein [Propionicimonas sp.]|uniref:hypothetical protein n=1 Tax=Propionicimonas sp. TaxID=1955623 RepID=UPI0018099D96|nr:hypothetical protein [Propionicimonas sp.]MBU3976284.1 hypothetical protein [Actinomycetota bacterium]MBA3022122.1 CpsD/CapB family tyrosine-protein kinase [Propionicimonas sp.]MBU3987441.1 hypothetical protein [Actinomycetota bacterium]MBU4006614.1 hypothetical protein [Actinomycetota bacterium]MBU4065219.1 hypothetical protein [Actinomycetota bacterium]
MSVFLLTSAAHSPGVTTLGVALAVHGSEPALLVDANREPDQSVLAGYLGGADPQGRGLGGLLQAHRERRPLELVLASMTLPLGEHSDFLPGFTHPGMVSLFNPVWPELATALEAEQRTVLVDAGRLGATGLPAGLISACSGVLVCTRTALPDLAALRLYLPQVIEAVGEERVGLVLVGPGRPYTGTEIQRRFSVPIWGHLAWKPEEAEVYSHGRTPGRRHQLSSYLDDVRALDHRLAERDLHRRALLGPRP